MTWIDAADIGAAIFLISGSLLALAAAIGLVRFPDLLTRMHAATKPQTLGLLLILIGLGLRLRDPQYIGILVLVGVFQLATAPVAAHMVGRTAFRSTPIRRDLLYVDELSEQLDDDG